MAFAIGVIFLASAAAEKYDYSYNDPPNVVIAKKIAKTVIHKKSSDKYF